MKWKCPDCGAENPDSKFECACGYAYYRVMGIKPHESEKVVTQTYKYLLTVWHEDKIAHDPIALKNVRDRKKKIIEAYELFRKHFTPALEDSKKETSHVKIISMGVLVILVIAGLIIYLTSPQKGAPAKQTVVQGVNEDIPRLGGNQTNVQTKPEETNASRSESTGQQIPPSDQRSGLSTETLPDDPEGKAVALVKRSHVIDKFMDVDMLMKKWTDEYSAKFQVLGWKAKKVDDQLYLVGYTITDGLATKGFYFDVDLSTGTVRHLAEHPELQKKYNIHYTQ